MPEGPEVFYMVRNLNKNYKDLILTELNILSGRYTKHGYPKNYEIFKKNLPSRIKKFHCKGKLIWIEFIENLNILIILGYAHFTEEKDKNTPLEFITKKKKFYLKDIRHFATINFLSNEELHKKIKARGPSIVTNEMSETDFEIILKIQKEKKPENLIGSLLLDQYLISGIGNYIRADALYLSKLSPFTKIKDLKTKQIQNLFKSIKKVINESLKALSKNNLYDCLVYRKDMISGNKIQRDELTGRSIYWVPEIQK